MVYKHAVFAAFLIYAQQVSMVKMLLKGEVGGRALDRYGNYIVDHRKSWKNRVFEFL